MICIFWCDDSESIRCRTGMFRYLKQLMPLRQLHITLKQVLLHWLILLK